MEEVCERENCWQAYKRVKANKGSPGIDGMKVGELSGYLKQHWLAAYLRGWKSYFGYCQTPSLLKTLDEWIRRRLRSTIWKQWKRGHVRFRKLRQRGVSITLIANTIRSCHGPWRLANSPALSIALPIAYFDSLGLPRLFDGPA
jgi:Group II intron, maturase-specific domain